MKVALNSFAFARLFLIKVVVAFGWSFCSVLVLFFPAFLLPSTSCLLFPAQPNIKPVRSYRRHEMFISVERKLVDETGEGEEAGAVITDVG